jgi:3-phosphoshikimate 1-carboxyvinyltransferase
VSTQGDKRFAEVMGLMGADVQWSPYSITITGPKAAGKPLKGIDHDCNDIPDAAMTLAVAALFAEVSRGRAVALSVLGAAEHKS